jgi:hypothetical protein
LGNSGLDPHILAFSTPENLIPAFWHFQLPKKKKLEKKGHKNHLPPQKVRALPFVLARWVKKVGVEQEKVAQVILDSA